MCLNGIQINTQTIKNKVYCISIGIIEGSSYIFYFKVDILIFERSCC